MSPRIELAEFLTAYLAEVEEHLSVANARVLAIEVAEQNGGHDPRAVRDLFRALHTVKGLSSMVGVEPIVAIAHRMEAILRGADRAGGALAKAALEPLLDGLGAIEVRLRALRDKKPVPAPPAALLRLLEATEGRDDATPRSAAPALLLEPALSGKLAAFETQQILRAIAAGHRALRIEFVPSVERAAAGQSINSVRERVGALADIVKVIPISLPANDAAPAGLAFVLLVTTSESDEAVAAAAGLDSAALRPIGLEGATDAQAPLVPLPELEPELFDEKPEKRSVLRVDVSRVDDAMEVLSSLIVSRSRLVRVVSTLAVGSAEARELKQVVTDVTRQLRDLRSSILRVRMVRVADVLERIPLLISGLRRTTGKRVRLELDTGDAELDKAVAERIFPAVLHLVRNAVDHGIESPEERRAAGKPEEGLIRITTSSRSNRQLELLVSDDGRGVDRARVAARAMSPVPTSEASLLDLLCKPGLSTREEVTTTSGRGMGMDIVRRVVVGTLGGELLLSTREGVGTSFALHVPLTIAIVDAFTVRCGAERFVVPVAMVEEIVEVDESRVVSAPMASLRGGAPTQLGMMERRGEVVPLIDLAAMLGMSADPLGSKKALVIRRAGQPVGFVVERVLGQQETVVRPLLDPLVNVRGVAGATDLGEGRPTLVLDLVALAAPAPSKLLRAPPSLPALPGETSPPARALPAQRGDGGS